MNRAKKATIPEITGIGELVVMLSGRYKIKKKGEFFFDALMFPLLYERYPDVKRQIPLKLRNGQKKAQRIDFRLGGSNPTVIELAHGSRHGGIGPSTNYSELEKLCRQRKARTRFLLLLDASRLKPLTKAELKAQYKKCTIGPGQFARLPVQVIYARPNHSFSFRWEAKCKKAV